MAIVPLSPPITATTRGGDDQAVAGGDLGTVLGGQSLIIQAVLTGSALSTASQPPGAVAATLSQQRYTGWPQKFQFPQDTLAPSMLPAPSTAVAKLVAMHAQRVMGFKALNRRVQGIGCLLYTSPSPRD